MTTLPQMGLVLPTRGPSGAGVWDDSLDTDLSLVDAHDHSTGKGTAVPTSGININADLTFGSLYAPIGLHRITFASIVALTSSNKSLFVNTADNELYWRNNTGTNVKLTSGNALNVAAFTGGIGGDYTAVSAALNFDSAGNRYTLKGASGTSWARMASGDVRLFETGTTDAVFVGLAAPSALAGSYTITMPLAAPGSTSIVQMDSGGVLTASNTVANAVSLGSTLGVTGAVTMSAAATVGTTLGVTGNTTVGGTLGVTGLATVGGTLGVTGLVTATAGVTSPADLITTGTGDHRHAVAWEIPIAPAAFIALSGSVGAYEAMLSAPPANTFHGRRISTSGSATIHAPVHGVRTGDTITTVEFDFASTANIGTVTVVVNRQKQGVSSTTIGSATVVGVSVGQAIRTATCNYTLVAGDIIYVEVISSDTTTYVTGVRVKVTRP